MNGKLKKIGLFIGITFALSWAIAILFFIFGGKWGAPSSMIVAMVIMFMPIEYGLGIMRFRLPRLFTGMRRMPAVIGHTGSTGAWLFYCEELDLLLAGTVDQATAGAIPYRVVPKLLRDYTQLVSKGRITS